MRSYITLIRYLAGMVCGCLFSTPVFAKAAAHETQATTAWPVLTGPLVTAAGILVTVLIFMAGNRRQSRNEFRRGFWTLRCNTYEKVLAILGRMLSVHLYPEVDEPLVAEHHPRFHEAYAEFRALYWGVMTLVEDRDVANAMQAMDATLQAYRRGALGHRGLQVEVDRLRKAMKGHLKESWTALGMGSMD